VPCRIMGLWERDRNGRKKVRKRSTGVSLSWYVELGGNQGKRGGGFRKGVQRTNHNWVGPVCPWQKWEKLMFGDGDVKLPRRRKRSGGNIPGGSQKSGGCFNTRQEHGRSPGGKTESGKKTGKAIRFNPAPAGN